MMASIVSAKPAVRDFLLDMQREMGKGKALVCEGRDMGTVIFPEADIKFFLDADPHVRACRRYKEMPPKTAVTLEDISRDMLQRDQNDSRRALSPLKPADDAIRIDCTHIDPQGSGQADDGLHVCKLDAIVKVHFDWSKMLRFYRWHDDIPFSLYLTSSPSGF